jgi:hypothetical protein
MTRSPLRRKTAALFLATALFASWASAAEPSEPSTRGFVAQLWSFLISFTPDAGCRPDPSGHCGSEATVTPDAGCRLDPNGICVSGS